MPGRLTTRKESGVSAQSRDDRRTGADRRADGDRRLARAPLPGPSRRIGFTPWRLVEGDARPYYFRSFDDRRFSAERRRSRRRPDEHAGAGPAAAGEEQDGRLQFFQIDEATLKVLSQLNAILELHVDRILHEFYLDLKAKRKWRAAFGEADVEAVLSHVKRHWLENVFTGDLANACRRRLSARSRTAASSPLQLDGYLAACNFLLNRVNDVLLAAYHTPERVLAALRAIHQALLLDIDFAVKPEAGGATTERPLVTREEIAVLLNP